MDRVRVEIFKQIEAEAREKIEDDFLLSANPIVPKVARSEL